MIADSMRGAERVRSALVSAGDADKQGSDFLAVVDVDRQSPHLL